MTTETPPRPRRRNAFVLRAPATDSRSPRYRQPPVHTCCRCGGLLEASDEPGLFCGWCLYPVTWGFPKPPVQRRILVSRWTAKFHQDETVRMVPAL